MIELKTLSFKNIRRFTETQIIDLTDRDKLIQVDGKNLNTGGSSGAGKTTVFLALDYLLGISDVPSTVLQSRLTKEGIFVAGHFDVDGRPLNVIRSKKGLTVEFDGETISGNVKMAEEKLDEIIGIPRAIFKRMVHKKQKEGGFFIDMTGKQTYEFLSNVLNFDKYKQAADRIDEQTKSNKLKIEEIKTKLAVEEATISANESAINTKTKPQPPKYNKDFIESLKKEITDKEIALNSALNALDIKVQGLARPEENKKMYDDTVIEKAEEELKAAKAEELEIVDIKKKMELDLRAFDNLAVQNMQLTDTIKKYEQEKAHLESGTCVTCNQKWVGEAATSRLKELAGQIDQANSILASNTEKLQEKSKMEQNIARLEGILQQKLDLVSEARVRLDNVKKEKHEFELKKIQENSELMSEYKAELAKITSAKQELKFQKQSEIDSIKNTILLQQHELDNYNTNLNNYEKELKDLAQKILTAKENIAEMTKERDELASSILVADEAKRLIKSYIVKTFQDTLNSIGTLATEIMAGIPNMSNSTVYFDGYKENKDGSLKEEVTGVVNMDGEVIPIKSLSGGERTAIDLAVDLAVIEVIEQRTGKGANFYIVDEPFDGLDAVCRENCLEILKQIDINKKIIMVDHSSELKEMVGDVITIVRDGETSTVEG